MIYLETYGCTMNKSDSEIMRYLLRDELTDDLSMADVVIINSCGVKEKTERKIRRRIRELNGKRIILAGCLPRISQVDGVSQIGCNIYDVLDVVREVRKGKIAKNVDLRKRNKLEFEREREGCIAIVPISEGCLGSCSFCATKFARGSLMSYPKDCIIEEVRKCVSQGFKEIQLTAQDTGCYGFDIGSSLPELLKEIVEIPGKFRVRAGMMNPNHLKYILDELLEIYKNEKLYKFLHLPLQSGNDEILKLMGRGYTSKDFIIMVERFKREIPDLYLSTDVICGFPLETDEQFEDTLRVIERLKPDKVNVTRFSPRPKTKASKMPQFPDRIRKERSRKLSKLRLKISEEINRKYLSKDVEVLISEVGRKDTMIGRTSNYKPVVCRGELGEFKKVRIRRVKPTYLSSL
ncbi:MAG: tRNA (N(6)-L-threonylcarbamoyladenosine(37)-C(2))-methylthiotransferase [Candidatus Methanofastidiosia archaeon]